MDSIDRTSHCTKLNNKAANKEQLNDTNTLTIVMYIVNTKKTKTNRIHLLFAMPHQV